MSDTMREDAVLVLLDVAARIERRLDNALSMARGISFSEYRLLKAIAGAGERGVMRVDLAESVGLTASAVTRALRPLEKIGVVATEKHERDARCSLAKLTPAGAELLRDAESVVADGLDAIPMKGLSLEKLAGLQAELSKPRQAFARRSMIRAS
ncbi:MAG TPA: MarR family transcriptional regulator [Methyloceanibacter sp.]|nr:MarR family transcriptional regulator [Methyloceanibacter sp.]